MGLFGKKLKSEHKVLRKLEQEGAKLQRETHKPTPECPHPERWHMYDSMSAEAEVLDFLRALVTTVKPSLIVETGTFVASSTLWMAEGLRENGFGRIVTCENDPKLHAKAKENIERSGLAEWIELRSESSLEMKVAGTIDLLFSDSAFETREPEVRRFLPQMTPHGLILMHDASSHHQVVREAALRMEREGLIAVVLLPTPRGLVLAQKR